MVCFGGGGFAESAPNKLSLCVQSDAKALRIVLSLSGVPGGLRGHVVVEMGDMDNEQLVKLVGGGIGVETVVAHDVIGRLMIQCARQPGLAQVRRLYFLDVRRIFAGH